MPTPDLAALAQLDPLGISTDLDWAPTACAETEDRMRSNRTGQVLDIDAMAA